ncbi:Rieske (2Fe-2S) protein [Stieleria sp. TO1_6]|uniref:Rieske (2Fe-2S) protein n=1 Tax=Stieleria tagensis TaxID=2956795 RepID=UPI00209ABB15|nr:Rieske (2Fe-2S) protein [Stieleria tagensis]MCO8122205.1 Rieske (2Fe-2S) protein [Stieleria tagensis]
MDSQSHTTWIDVADAAEIPDGCAKEVVVGQWVIAVFCDGDDYYAIDGMCAHQGGPIAKGQLSKTDRGLTCVTCPWHGWQYELATGIQTVNHQPLQRVFPVRRSGDRIEIRVDE